MSTATKTPYSVIRPVADRIVEALAPYCERIELAGSLRRQRPNIGDIEIVAIPRRPANLFGQVLDKEPTALDRFLDERLVLFPKRGRKYQQFIYGPYTVDLFLPTAETWGCVLAIRTGSAEFSHWLVSPQPRGACPWSVRFGGKDAQPGRLLHDGRLLATPEESDVFAALGLAWVEPEERHGPIVEPVRVEPIWRYA
jgi:DNA polymerase/3'-5' exonuclease PolX